MALCFNPCYRGLVIRTVKSMNHTFQITQFQSLLSWISDSNRYLALIHLVS